MYADKSHKRMWIEKNSFSNTHTYHLKEKKFNCYASKPEAELLMDKIEI